MVLVWRDIICGPELLFYFGFFAYRFCWSIVFFFVQISIQYSRGRKPISKCQQWCTYTCNSMCTLVKVCFWKAKTYVCIIKRNCNQRIFLRFFINLISLSYVSRFFFVIMTVLWLWIINWKIIENKWKGKREEI